MYIPMKIDYTDIPFIYNWLILHYLLWGGANYKAINVYMTGAVIYWYIKLKNNLQGVGNGGILTYYLLCRITIYIAINVCKIGGKMY